jgi:hypothetical protein
MRPQREQRRLACATGVYDPDHTADPKDDEFLEVVPTPVRGELAQQLFCAEHKVRLAVRHSPPL